MKKSAHKLTALLLVLVIVLGGFAGCSPVAGNESSPAASPSQGASTAEGSQSGGAEPTAPADGQVVIRIPFDHGEPSSLDPGFGNSTDSISARGIMYEGLVRIYENKIEPAMAESWDVSEDGLTYTFHLRDSKWADGQPVTAQDFVYGITRLLDPSPDAPNGNYSWMGYYFKNGREFNKGEATAEDLGVRAIDEKTLEITATAVMPYFIDLMKMPCFYPVRQDIAEQYGKEYASAPDKTLCNGPFILTQWDHESKLVFEKNPGYWNADAINVDVIEGYIITDPETTMNMFDAGELDVINSLRKENVQKYVDTGEAVVINGATIWFTAVNTKTDRGEASKLLQNQNFRQALAYVVDRESLVGAARGDGSFAISRIAPDLMTILDTTWGEKYPYSPYPLAGDAAKAEELFQLALTETGLSKDSLPDMTLLTWDDPAAKVIAEVLQNVMKTSFNINITIDQQTYSGRVDKENQGDYDFCITNWAPDYNDPMTFLECYVSDSSYNMYFGGLQSAEYDALIAKANSTLDFEERAEAMFEAEKMMLDTATLVPLFQTSGYWAKKTWLEGVNKCGFGANDPDYSLVHVNK